MKLLYWLNLQWSQQGLVCQSTTARLLHALFDTNNTWSLLPTCLQITTLKNKHYHTSSLILHHLWQELWCCSTCMSHYCEAPGETAYICCKTLTRPFSNSCMIWHWWMRMISWKSWIKWCYCGGREWEALKDGRRCWGSTVRHQMLYSIRKIKILLKPTYYGLISI